MQVNRHMRTCQLCNSRLRGGAVARALQLRREALLTQLHKLGVTEAALCQLRHPAVGVLGLELQALQHAAHVWDAALQLQVLAALQHRHAAEAEGPSVTAAAKAA